MIRFILCFLLFALSSSFLWSQKFGTVNYSLSNGLPSDEVYDVHQDQNGIIWFATDRGLVRFDGKNIRTFTKSDGLPTIAIQKFFPQENGEILCSTISNKLFFFNPENSSFRHYKYIDQFQKEAKGHDISYLFLTKDNSLVASFHNALGALVIDKDGNVQNTLQSFGSNEMNQLSVHVSNSGDIFSCWNNELTASNLEVIFNRFEFQELSKIPKEYSIFFRHTRYQNMTLVSIGSDLYRISNSGTVTKESFEHPIISIGKFDDTHYWLGFLSGGFVVIDAEGKFFYKDLEGFSVSDVHLSNEGVIWASTLESGVYSQVYNEFFEPTNNIRTRVTSLNVDAEDKLWATINDNRLYFKSKKSLVPAGLVDLDATNPEARMVFGYTEQFGSIISFKGEVRAVKDGDLILNEYLLKVADDSNSTVLLGLNKLFLPNTTGGIDVHELNSRVYDACIASDRLLVATSNGLLLYDPNSRGVQMLETDLINSRITDVSKFGMNYLIGTIEDGLILYDLVKNRFIPVDAQLSSNSVHTIRVYDDRSFWAGTNKGVNFLTLNYDGSYSCDQIGIEDGLIHDYVNDIELIGDTIYVATAKGLTWFHRNLFDKQEQKADYHLKLEKWRLNGSVSSWKRELPYIKNSIAFGFSAVSFRNNRTLKYRYRLLGLSEEWKETTNREAVFERLPAGEYVFQVEVGVRGRWTGQTKEWAFRINEAFYATWWFILLMVLVTGAVVYLFFRYRILSYNRDILREMLRYLLKRLKLNSNSFVVREGGKDVKINSENVLYVKSLGNYLEIHTLNGKIVIRETLSGFLVLVPDAIEYLRVHRSYIVRIDRIEAKNSQVLTMSDGIEISIGKKYAELVHELSL